MNNSFWDQQQQFFKTWNDTFMNKMPGMSTYENMYKSMMPGMTDYWTKVKELMPNPQDTWKTVFKAMPSFESMASVWPVKIPGMDLYGKVFDLWKGLGDPASFLQNYQHQYSELMQEFMKNFMPAGSLGFFEKPQELLDACVNYYKEVLSPWMEIDTSILERLAMGDRRAYTDFFHEFNQKYEESFAKMFSMMGMGANRESNQDQMQAISTYIKMLFAAGEMAGLILDSFKDSMQRLVERYNKGLQEGKVLTTFREFYDFWYGVTEEVLLELLNTDEFARIFGDFSDKYSKYMIATNKVYERMLSTLPIPTKTDMDSLYKTVYDLRKDVRDLRRELNAMKETK